MDCIVGHPTLAAPLQLPEALFLKYTCLPPPPSNARVSAIFRFFLPSHLHHTTEETMKQRFAGEGFTLVSFTGEGEKKNSLHAQNTLYQQIVGEGEGRNCELAECAMSRDVSVRAYGGADEETVGDMMNEGTGFFSKKSGEEEEKRRGVS